VSVCVPTYNHVDYVSDCLNGILCQETTFAFEILVRDDASQDGTQEVLKHFQSLYPDIIQLTLNEHNEFPGKRPLAALMAVASAEFIALCEGDDYWIREDKLERQATLLLADQGRSAVAHSVATLRSNELEVPSSEGGRWEFVRGDMQAIAHLQTVSLMFRHLKLSHEDLNKGFYGDVILKSQLCSRGSILIENNYCASVYRVHSGGLFSSLDPREADRKGLISHFAAAQLLAERGDRQGAADLFALSVRESAEWFQRNYGVDIVGKTRGQLGTKFRLFNRLRSKWRTSPIARRWYFRLKGRSDPRL